MRLKGRGTAREMLYWKIRNKKDARSSNQTNVPSASSALVVLAVQSFLVGDFCNICHQTLGTLICMF